MKRPKALLIGCLIGTGYAFYLLYCALTGRESPPPPDGEGLITMALGVHLLAPHLAFVALGACAGWVGFARRWGAAALAGVILYTASLVFLPMYAIFLLLPVMLGFRAFSQLDSTKHGRSDVLGRAPEILLAIAFAIVAVFCVMVGYGLVAGG